MEAFLEGRCGQNISKAQIKLAEVHDRFLNHDCDSFDDGDDDGNVNNSSHPKNDSSADFPASRRTLVELLVKFPKDDL
jgi:hypothetical protein